MRGGSVAIIGGSIAGCAAALAVNRCGAEEVVVFERAASDLQDRGVGLGIHDDRYTELRAAGFLDDAMPSCPLTERQWFARDGAAPLGRRIAVQPFPFRTYNWGSLWRELRRRVPQTVEYRTDATVAEVQDGDSGALVRLADGTERAYDLVIGADGYRSVARASLFPGSEPGFAGYIGWRGTFPAKRLDEIDGRPGWDTRESVTIGFDGGHLMAYRIPGDAGEIINWLIYATPPAGIDVRPESPAGFPPGRVTEDLIRHFHALAEDRLPPYWADAVRLTDPERLFVQPIYDLEAPTYAGRRVLLMGDAAVVARPHTGAGAVKALQDVAIMEELWHDAESWEQLLASYDAVRRPVGHAVVELGRRIGRAQVIEARDWGRHDQASFDAWIREQLGVESLGSRALGRP